MMADYQSNKIYQQASSWAKQLKTDSSFTPSDVEELKIHLIDLAEELQTKGLDEEEAFLIASARMGDISVLRDAFEEVNTPIVQMRNAILILSGIFSFFLLYFVMLFFVRFLVIVFHEINPDPIANVRTVLYFVIFCHVLVIGLTLTLFFAGNTRFKKVELYKLKPKHTIGLYISIIVFAISDLLLKAIIRSKFELGSYTSNRLYSLFDYLQYSFPLVLIICFLLLFRKFYLAVTNNTSKINKETGIQLNEENVFVEVLSNPININDSSDQIQHLRDIGLEEDEVSWILKKRKGVSNQNNEIQSHPDNGFLRFFIFVLSGIMVYFSLHFLLFSTTRVLFTVLQYIENDALLNIKRCWSYVIVFQLFFIFFSISLCLRDNNINKLLKCINFKPVYACWIFFATIFLAIIDRCFYPFSQNTIETDIIHKMKFANVFFYSGYSFPFILCTCFLVLFYQYYRDNIQVG